jgi:glycosyltransferase involved in cell wall biosynthesis
MKVYLCGITQDKKEKIDELTKDVFNHFDGLIFVDGGSKDGTRELLEERKGQGTIIYRKWTNDFDFQNNEILRQGGMKNGY